MIDRHEFVGITAGAGAPRQAQPINHTGETA
jgi:hypothetical protein